MHLGSGDDSCSVVFLVDASEYSSLESYSALGVPISQPSRSTWPRYPHWQARNTQHLAVLEKRRIAEIVEEHVGCVVAPKKVSVSNETGNAEYASGNRFVGIGFQLFLDARLRYPLVCVGNA